MIAVILISLISTTTHAQSPNKVASPDPDARIEAIHCLEALGKSDFALTHARSREATQFTAIPIGTMGADHFASWDGKTIRRINKKYVEHRRGGRGTPQNPDLVEKILGPNEQPRGEVLWSVDQFHKDFDGRTDMGKKIPPKLMGHLIRDFIAGSFATFVKESHIPLHLTQAEKTSVLESCRMMDAVQFRRKPIGAYIRSHYALPIPARPNLDTATNNAPGLK